MLAIIKRRLHDCTQKSYKHDYSICETRNCVCKFFWALSVKYSRSCAERIQVEVEENRVIHTGHWIRIQCGSGIRFQRPLYLHTASIWIRAACCVAWQCSRTAWKIQSSSAMRVVCVPHVELNRDHIESETGIRILWIRFQCPCGKPQWETLVGTPFVLVT